MSHSDVVVMSPLNQVEMTNINATNLSKTSHSVRNPIHTDRHPDWKDDMERANYVVLVKTKHEGWLRKCVCQELSAQGLMSY